MKSRGKAIALRLAVVAGALLVWEAAAGGLGLGWNLLEPSIVARPTLIAADLAVYAASGLLLRDLRATLTAAFLGLILGTLGGVATGLFFGYWRRTADVFEPFMAAFISLPLITVAPLLILWFGLGMTSRVLLSMFSVFFIVFFNTYQGMRNVDPDLIRAVRIMGGGSRDAARMVVLPSVCTWIFAALRTSAGLALTGAVVAEFVGSTDGLGYRMVFAAGLMHPERVFSIMLLLMTIGVTASEIARRAEQYLLCWRPPPAPLD